MVSSLYVFPANILYTCHFSHALTYPAHLILFDVITLTIFGEA